MGNYGVRKESIDKTVDFLNSMKSKYDNNEDFVIESFCKEKSISSSRFYNAVILGYFNRISIGKYKCMVDLFTKDHAKKLILYGNKFYHQKKEKAKLAQLPFSSMQIQPVIKPIEFDKKSNKELIEDLRAIKTVLTHRNWEVIIKATFTQDI
jgi:hypothetical protein